MEQGYFLNIRAFFENLVTILVYAVIVSLTSRVCVHIYLLYLLCLDVCAKLVSCPACTCFLARNGLVSKVEFFALVPKSGKELEIVRSVIIT